MRGQKIQLMDTELLRFRDSFQLLPLLLSKLSEHLREHDCIYQTNFFLS